MGLNHGAVCFMDIIFFTFNCRKNCIVCLKRPKINEKEAGFGTFKKNSPIRKRRVSYKQFVETITRRVNILVPLINCQR